MPNALTTHVGLKAGPWFLETLVRHYFDRMFHDRKEGVRDVDSANDESGKLRRDELLYDEVFHIVKSFLEVSTHHTIEELQQFSNTQIPSSPWMHVMRVRVPLSCCDDAAEYLIDALGGQVKTRQIVGGTKWWQVRGIRGVDAQWIVARKDHQRVRKQQKQHQQQAEQLKQDHHEEDAVYDPEMDELRCILYFHGGGYYFGSVDQERYFIQRFARKSGCRLLAISYRLAPQYPFPCAIQDAVASYLYLIRPPPGAPHTPVNPAHVIVAGDSAGGGLTLALLQVIRDTGLPMPAGAIPISPWCDLTHSFPSIHLNTDTDVTPKYGLSIYKPSVLWPPPSDDLTHEVQAGIRSRIKQIARQYRKEADGKTIKEEPERRSRFWRRALSYGATVRDRHSEERSVSRGRDSSRIASREILADDARTGDVRAAAVSRSRSGKGETDGGKQTDMNLDTGPSAPLPTADDTKTQTLSVKAESGDMLEVRDQVHMYAPNNLLVHPLVSPAMSYLGGLPPLLIIASDGEVLRDEIIYTAQKAAHPERYPVKPEAKKLYPRLEGIEDRYGPTRVHLQVYDHAAHTFPVLFFVCSSSKFCFRAMANFSKYVLGTLPVSPSASATNVNGSGISDIPSFQGRKSFRLGRSPSLNVSVSRRLSMMGSWKKRASFHQEPNGSPQIQSQSQLDGQISESPAQATDSPGRTSIVSSRSSTSERLNSSTTTEGVRLAGDPSIYTRLQDGLTSPFVDNMIRERVSTRGEIRPLEPESELTACTMPLDRIGVASELVLRRYIEGSTKWNEKFAKAKEHIRKQRAHSLKLAKYDAAQIVPQLQMPFFLHAEGEEGIVEADSGDATHAKAKEAGPSVKEGLKPSVASWAWAWALDGAERPPPSSIVSRRDTEEARRLSRIADLPADTHDHRVSGNNLWTYLVNRLSLEKNEAKVEQHAVEKDPKGIAKDVSFDSTPHRRKGKGKEKENKEKNMEGTRDASKERKRRPHWPRSLSRAANRTHHSERRGSIFRLKSTPAIRAEARDDGNNAELPERDIGRVKSN
ncbi:hypothetical protein ACEPAF_5605 [Sanghuangporus sanghuang]